MEASHWRLFVSPLVIALAEEAGIAEELGFVILQQACTDLNTLDKLFGHSLHVAVNITATQLENEQCVERLQNLLQQYDFSPEKLCLELTEQTALSSSPAITQRIKAIRNLGVNIVIDDFGMGHNSLIYLQNNQFDMVKLDGGLVKNIMTNQRCQDIIASILYLSKSLRFQVLAEFVETLEQKETLEHLGCTNYQGYLYSPAIPLPELTTYIQVHQINQF